MCVTFKPNLKQVDTKDFKLLLQVLSKMLIDVSLILQPFMRK